MKLYFLILSILLSSTVLSQDKKACESHFFIRLQDSYFESDRFSLEDFNSYSPLEKKHLAREFAKVIADIYDVKLHLFFTDTTGRYVISHDGYHYAFRVWDIVERTNPFRIVYRKGVFNCSVTYCHSEYALEVIESAEYRRLQETTYNNSKKQSLLIFPMIKGQPNV